jgi:cell division protein FtsB
MQPVKHHKEKFWHTRFWIAILVIFCGLLSISVFNIAKKHRHARTIRYDYQQELIQIQEHERILKENIASLSTDRGKEAEIRDRYRVVKEGEQMILIVDNDDKNDDPSVPEPSKNIFRRFIQFFKDL